MSQNSVARGDLLTLVGTSSSGTGVPIIPLGTPLSRLNYFDGKFLRAADLEAEQGYLRTLVQLSNQAGGAGVVHGFDTVLDGAGDLIRLGPGLAIDPQGRVLLLPQAQPIGIPDLLARSRGAAFTLATADRGRGLGDFGDCVVVADSGGIVPAAARDLWLITIGHAEALCGEEDVYGKLCEDACITSTDRPRRVEGLFVRALPLTVRPLRTSAAVALDRRHLRSLVASAYFADERARVGDLVSKAGLASEAWCLGALPQTGSDVPIAVLARAGATTIFLDAWTARRERIEAPARRYWAWRMAMRPWDVYLAQILQFQCQLHELLHDAPEPGSDDDPCRPQQGALDEASRYLEQVQQEYTRHLGALQQMAAATRTIDAQPFELPGGIGAISALHTKLVATLQQIFAGPRDRVLIRGGIVELPAAGYLPVVPGSAVTVNEQVRRLMGEGVDLRFCVVRPDFVAHALEEAQHMERISLLIGLDDAARREAVDILVPDGEIVEEQPRPIGGGWEVFLEPPDFTPPAVKTGAIAGSVTDPTGIALPGTPVQLTNARTGLTRDTVTDDKSQYGFSDLPPGGDYAVTVRLPGTPDVTRDALTVTSSQTLRVDFVLPRSTPGNPQILRAAAPAGIANDALAIPALDATAAAPKPVIVVSPPPGRAVTGTARPLLHGAGRSERLDGGGAAFHFAGVGDETIDGALGAMVRGIAGIQTRANLAALFVRGATAVQGGTATRSPLADPVPESPLDVDRGLWLSRLRLAGSDARVLASKIRADAVGLESAVVVVPPPVPPTVPPPSAAGLTAVWLSMELARNPWLLPDGARTPASLRLTVATPGVGAPYADVRVTGALHVEEPASPYGQRRRVVGRLVGDVIVRAREADGSESVRSVAFDCPMTLTAGTAANGNDVVEVELPLVRGAALVFAVQWVGRPVSVAVSARVVTAAGIVERPIARLREDADALLPGNPLREASTQAIAVIDAALARIDADFDLRATERLFPPTRPARETLTVRATRDWVLFHRRRDKRCAVVAPPPVQAPPVRLAVYHVLADVDGMKRLARLLRAGGSPQDFARLGRPVDVVEFAPGATTLATPRDALLQDWAHVPHGDSLLYGAIALFGADPAEESLAGGRLQRLEAALGGLFNTSGAFSERLDEVPVPLAVQGTSGIVVLASTQTVRLECHEVVRFVPGAGLGQISAFLTRPQTPLGQVSFVAGTVQPAGDGFGPVETKWAEAGGGSVQAVQVLLPKGAMTADTAKIRQEQATAIASRFVGGAQVRVDVIEATEPWTSPCDAITVLVPGQTRTDCIEAFRVDRDRYVAIVRLAEAGGLVRTALGADFLGTARFVESTEQAADGSVQVVADAWRALGGGPIDPGVVLVPVADQGAGPVRGLQATQIVKATGSQTILLPFPVNGTFPSQCQGIALLIPAG